ncbi:MAG TPA: S8 family serine peptidase [Candidatus Eisenbacteria bacterium]|nr:S8 family serine peptidase [Candidatus Eisenbacteria bacterium]
MVIGIWTAILVPGPARAELRPEARSALGRPLLIAPPEGQRLVESEARFAFRTTAGWRAETVVLSTRPFDSSAWTEVPARPELVTIKADRPVVDLSQSGIPIDVQTTIWWCVVARDPGTGKLAVSETRSFVALPKFANRVTPSFLLPTPTRTVVAPEELPPATGPARIHLAAGYDFAPAVAEPTVPAALATERASTAVESAGAIHSYLVQFDGPPSATERAALERAGAAVFAYVPDQAFLVRTTDQGRQVIQSLAHAAWVGEFRPAYKLSPLVDRAAAGDSSYQALLFPDADLSRARGLVQAMGLAVEGSSQNGVNKILRLRAPAARLAEVAGLADVAWIEPVIPMRPLNDLAQWVVQTSLNGNRRVWTMGIRGQGQVVTTSDTGIKTYHDMFRDPSVPITDFGDYPTHRKIIAYKRGSLNPSAIFGDSSTDVYHGTHTACTMVGWDDPVGGASARDGMAKEGKIYFMDIGGPQLHGFVDPFPDLNDLFLPPYLGNTGGAARISSNSWGGDVGGNYTLFSYETDQFIWSHPDFYVSFSDGNSGPAPGTVGTPATAKDCTSAGGTGNGTSETFVYAATSRGPTLDGRQKPTVCSPGQSVTSAYGPGTAAYATLSGTSMASPTGAGAVTLMRQYCTDGWYPTGAAVPADGFSPSAALLKAMAINSADMSLTGLTAPDNNIGYGRIDADNVLYFAGDTRRLLLVDQTQGLAQGQALEYPVYVSDGSIPLKVSLCWSDYPGNPAAAIQLVNDLDLTVSQGATAYHGNNFSGGFSVTGGAYDHRNVEEEVVVNTPTPGLWTVRISAPTVPLGPQPFGLVITGGVGNGAASLAFDRPQYGESGTVQLQVTDANAGPSLQVAVSSTTESTPENVTLTGTDGIYHGSLTLVPQTTAANDGQLAVSEGDVLTAVYQDANPATTLTATAQVSFDTPQITNVKAVSPSQGAVLVTWTTDRPADSRVDYGLTPALELGNVTVAQAGLDHAVWITGLTPGSMIRYDVRSSGLTGSVTKDDAGGAHRSVTVKGLGSALLLFNETPYIRSFPWQDALAADGVDYDLWTGDLAETPFLGNRSGGLRAYGAVLWDAGLETYPPVSDVQAAALTSYLNNGGRLAICGHDIAWGLAASGVSPTATPGRVSWLNNTLRATYLSDIASFSAAVGVASDPVTGNYTGGIPYTPVWSGAAGDEVGTFSAGGISSVVWKTSDSTPKNVGLKWESASGVGNPDSSLWGGQTSRLVDLFFEFGSLAPPFSSPNATRNDVLDKTLDWLLGRERPTVAVTSPNGGESFAGGSVSVQWTEAAGTGRTIADRTIEYSLDGGASWTTLAAHAGSSPYSWDASAVPNAATARVRVRVVDDGAPPLAALDASDANFALARASGDAQGPLIVPGSITVNPDPVVRPSPVTLTASASDVETGGANVVAAEWSMGNAPDPAGSGLPLGGSFGSQTAALSGSLDTTPFITGNGKLWVRAKDAAGNWGPAAELDVVVNGASNTSAEALPRVLELSAGAPNPFVHDMQLSFGLPKDATVNVSVFDVNGRLVKRLAFGAYPAGRHAARWDGTNEGGRAAPAGIYWCRLVTAAGVLEKRLVRL